MRFLLPCSLLCILALGLTSCSYLVPDDPSAPRYNSVIGERHRPQLNNTTAPQGSLDTRVAPMASVVEQPTSLTVERVDVAPLPSPQNIDAAPNFPPVDGVTKARAEQEMAMLTPSTPTATASMSTALPAAVIPAQVRGGSATRQVPTENVATDYPSLNNVPPRPALTGPGSADDRLERARRELERDRINAMGAKDQLGRDAASEPSMLPPSAPAPVVTPPAVAPSPQTSLSLTPPPSASMFAPPPPLNAPSAALNTPVENMPQAISYHYAPEPIALHPPVEGANPLPSPAPVYRPMATAQATPAPALSASSSGFNPMEGAAPAKTYGSGSYLPPSRYVR